MVFTTAPLINALMVPFFSSKPRVTRESKFTHRSGKWASFASPQRIQPKPEFPKATNFILTAFPQFSENCTSRRRRRYRKSLIPSSGTLTLASNFKLELLVKVSEETCDKAKYVL